MGRKRRPWTIEGREQEMTVVRRFVRGVPDGRSALFLAGVAGVGKTTLWFEGVNQARRHSYQVLSCCPAASEARYPYAGLGDLLDSVGDEVLASLPLAARRALSAALLRSEPADHALLEGRAVASALHGVLMQLADAGPPLVVAVDDLQWLDLPSRRALSFAIRRLGDRPVGILLSERTDRDISVPLGLDRTLDDSRLHVLALGPLPPEPLERLLLSRLGAGLSPAVLTRLKETSGGNPFYGLELGRALLRQGAVLGPGQALPIPDSLREVVKDRLKSLTAGAREAILAVSALARPTPGLVYAACDDVGSDSDPLGDAIEARVVEVDGDGVRLTHPLLASVAYAAASAQRRRMLHARLSSVVEDPEERARHLALSVRGPDEAVAAALQDASRKARNRGAPQVAAALAEQAIQLTPVRHAEAARRRTLETAEHHFAAGEMARARELFDRVRAAAPPGSDRARVVQRIGETRAQERGLPAAEELFRQALTDAGGDDLLRIELECDLAFARLAGGDIPGGAARARAALKLADSLAHVPLSAMLGALVCASLFEFLSGHGVAHDLLDRAVAIDEWDEREAVHLRAGFLHLPHIPATILKWSDNLVAARRLYTLAYTRTAELGEESWLPWLGYHMAELECWAGNWDQATIYADEACAAAERTGQEGVRGFTLYARALVAAHRGEVLDARKAAEEGLAVSEHAGIVMAAQLNRAVLAFLALSRGDAQGVLLQARPVREALSAMGLTDPGVVRCLPDEIEALIGLGDLQAAAALARRLARQGQSLDRPWARAAAARCQALLAAAARDWDGALGHLARAQEEHERLGQPFEWARTLLIEGTIRRRARQKRAAREALEAALRIFDSLGAPLWAANTQAELNRIGGRPAAPQTLTPTEEQVVALVASGWTNKEVATSMFISVKTVESNLHHIFRKLGISSRRDLARNDHEPVNGAAAADLHPPIDT